MAVEGELTKPRVEVITTGSDKEAAEEWKKSAFNQARRANGLRGKLKAIRDDIDAALKADEDDEND